MVAGALPQLSKLKDLSNEKKLNIPQIKDILNKKNISSQDSETNSDKKSKEIKLVGALLGLAAIGVGAVLCHKHIKNKNFLKIHEGLEGLDLKTLNQLRALEEKENKAWKATKKLRLENCKTDGDKAKYYKKQITALNATIEFYELQLLFEKNEDTKNAMISELCLCKRMKKDNEKELRDILIRINKNNADKISIKLKPHGKK